MAAAELGARTAPGTTHAGSARLRELLLTHALPGGFFGLFCGVKCMLTADAASRLLATRGGTVAGYPSLLLVDQLLGLLYFALLAFVCMTRLPRRAGRRGPGTVALAMFASFGIMLVGVLPDRQPRPQVEALSGVLLAAGLAYSVWALAWLHRSFSILPEARRLVTGGPYGLSRHPLYLGEGLATMGLLLHTAGPTALLLATAVGAAQLVRIRWEEGVMSAQFPEYLDYSRRVPRYLPFLG